MIISSNEIEGSSVVYNITLAVNKQFLGLTAKHTILIINEDDEFYNICIYIKMFLTNNFLIKQYRKIEFNKRKKLET